MYKDSDTSENNFWISYADLLAGLLFVFILLLGAIVTKYIITKSNASKLSENLKTTQVIMNENQKLIISKDKKITELLKLEESKRKELLSINEMLQEANKVIASKENDINKLQSNVDMKSQKIISLNDLVNEINKIVTTKDEELIKLMDVIKKQENKHEKLVADLALRNNKIKNLTGIKIKVISALKRALGDKMVIDPKSGSLRVSANILFDQGKATLKDGSKQELKEIFSKYIKTLVRNNEIRKHLDKIIIQGYTNSDGSYLYNLTLSQKRAYEVMKYLLTLDFAKKYNIKNLISASGRSSLDLIKDANGNEDKDASRRIEIKFLLKNDNAMKEIEKILEEG